MNNKRIRKTIKILLISIPKVIHTKTEIVNVMKANKNHNKFFKVAISRITKNKKLTLFSSVIKNQVA